MTWAICKSSFLRCSAHRTCNKMKVFGCDYSFFIIHSLQSLIFTFVNYDRALTDRFPINRDTALITIVMQPTKQVHADSFKFVLTSKHNVNLQSADTTSLCIWLGCRRIGFTSHTLINFKITTSNITTSKPINLILLNANNDALTQNLLGAFIRYSHSRYP